MGPEAQEAVPFLIERYRIERSATILNALARIGPESKSVLPILMETLKEDTIKKDEILRVLSRFGPEGDKRLLEILKEYRGREATSTYSAAPRWPL